MHEIFIYDVIGSSFWFGGVSAEDVGKELSDHDGEDIIIRINSPGGDVFEGMAIYNALQKHSGKVTVHVDGLAASAASLIAMGGDEVMMGAGTFIMIHQASTCVCGNADEMERRAGTLRKIDSQLIGIYQEKTGIDTETLTQMLKDETWLTADEAVEKGFADVKLKREDKETTNQAMAGAQILSFYRNVPDAVTVSCKRVKNSKSEQPKKAEQEPEPKDVPAEGSKPDFTIIRRKLDLLSVS